MTELETCQSRHSQVFLSIFRRKTDHGKENFPCMNSSFAKTAQFREFMKEIYFVKNEALHPSNDVFVMQSNIHFIQ